MPHAHFGIQHWLNQIEAAGPRPHRDVLPEWISELIEFVGEAFEPLNGVARVGFNTRPSEDRWEIEMYLGMTESVGGSADGHARFVSFQFDLRRVLARLNPLERCVWNAVPQPDDDPTGAAGSFALIEGRWGDHPVRLRIAAAPPLHAGPGLRQYADGRCEPTE